MSRPANGASAVGSADLDALETRVLREYYSDSEFFLSAEWILKVLAVVVCIALSGLLLGGRSCAGGPGGLVAGGAVLALGCAALAAVLLAGAALQLPAKAPRAWLMADITISTVLGILVLVSAILNVVICRMSNAAGYLLGPLGIAASLLMAGSAGATYAAAARRLDAARPHVEPRRPPPREHEV